MGLTPGSRFPVSGVGLNAARSQPRGSRNATGCLLDAIPAIIICAPILEPLTKAVGMDPVHFAMIGIVSLAFGLVTPPHGLCLMIACSIAGIRMRDAIRDTGMMLVPMLMVLALVIVWPKGSSCCPASSRRSF